MTNSGSDSIDDLVPSSEMLDEEVYWKLVEGSLNNSGNESEQLSYVTNHLESMTLKEMIGFRLRTDKLLYDSYTSEMWCAGYLMNKGCSDDGFEYFRNWIISRGREVYYAALKNPDTLIAQVDESLEYYDFELFWYVALEAFENRTGEDLHDYIDLENFVFSEHHYPAIEFNWQSKNPESMKAICPQLFAKMRK